MKFYLIRQLLYKTLNEMLIALICWSFNLNYTTIIVIVEQ